MDENLQNEELHSSETECVSELSEAPEAEQQEEAAVPLHEQKVFGVSRFAFWGILFGYGGGLVLCGIIGMLAKIEIKNTLLFGFGGAAVGYFIGEYLTKTISAKHPEPEESGKDS